MHPPCTDPVLTPIGRIGPDPDEAYVRFEPGHATALSSTSSAPFSPIFPNFSSALGPTSPFPTRTSFRTLLFRTRVRPFLESSDTSRPSKGAHGRAPSDKHDDLSVGKRAPERFRGFQEPGGTLARRETRGRGRGRTVHVGPLAKVHATSWDSDRRAREESDETKERNAKATSWKERRGLQCPGSVLGSPRFRATLRLIGPDSFAWFQDVEDIDMGIHEPPPLSVLLPRDEGRDEVDDARRQGRQGSKESRKQRKRTAKRMGHAANGEILYGMCQDATTKIVVECVCRYPCGILQRRRRFLEGFRLPHSQHMHAPNQSRSSNPREPRYDTSCRRESGTEEPSTFQTSSNRGSDARFIRFGVIKLP